MKNFRISARKIALIIAGALAVTGCTLRVFPKPQALDVAATEVDSSASVGVTDYVNLYQPTVSQLLPRLAGKTVRVSRVGGRRELLYSGRLAEGDAGDLRAFLFAIGLFLKTIPLESGAFRL